ncbi:DUF4893 domain-containing protein [Sphingomonas sp.]|uniref:DUF4893 domain-containing protein n=1 Tax=Sphingomonas sp. TaxID=28214 RepID=UPI00286B5FDD|nr:DUF4893 domain-containing protein [Sphingomonas sp.]
MQLLSSFLRIACLLGFVAITSGCAMQPKPVQRTGATVVVEPPPKSEAWTQIATTADETRISRLGLAWQQALAEAKPGFAGDIRREGVLLDPRGALPRPAPTPGSYNCRLIKLGKANAKAVAFERFKPFFCYVQVEDDLLTIVKQTGSQRPAGRLWEDDQPDRLIYLGSLALGDQQQPLAYGDDPKRDMAGVFERIAPFRWRLVIPWPQSTSKLDVFELTPVADQPK